MSADRDLERRIADFYATEAPARAPDWVLRSALETIDTTPQRRTVIRMPWRFPHMNTFAKFAIAAVVVIAIGAVGLSVLRPPSSSNVGGQPTASPSPLPSPTFGATIIPEPPPALTETFTSERHGFSISYPNGWVARPAIDPWVSGFPNFATTNGDVIHDPDLQDHLWIVVASRPLGAMSGTEWVDDMLAQQGDDCGAPAEPFTVVGGQGKVCTTPIAAASAGDRGYLMNLYTSGDDPSAVAAYDQAFFREVIATLRLQPEDAVDTAASSAPPS